MWRFGCQQAKRFGGMVDSSALWFGAFLQFIFGFCTLQKFANCKFPFFFVFIFSSTTHHSQEQK